MVSTVIFPNRKQSTGSVMQINKLWKRHYLQETTRDGTLSFWKYEGQVKISRQVHRERVWRNRDQQIRKKKVQELVCWFGKQERVVKYIDRKTETGDKKVVFQLLVTVWCSLKKDNPPKGSSDRQSSSDIYFEPVKWRENPLTVPRR